MDYYEVNVYYRRNTLANILEGLTEDASYLHFLRNNVAEEYDRDREHWGEVWAKRMMNDLDALDEAFDMVIDAHYILENRLSKVWYADE